MAFDKYIFRNRSERIIFWTLVTMFLVTVVTVPISIAKKMTAQEKKRQAKLEAKENLNDTAWEIELKPMATNKNKRLEEFTDTVRFENKKVNRIGVEFILNARLPGKTRAYRSNKYRQTV